MWGVQIEIAGGDGVRSGTGEGFLGSEGGGCGAGGGGGGGCGGGGGWRVIVGEPVHVRLLFCDDGVRGMLEGWRDGWGGAGRRARIIIDVCDISRCCYGIRIPGLVYGISLCSWGRVNC